MENFTNPEMNSENPVDTEPTAKIMARLLEDMESLGLIELFKANALGGGRVVSEQAEPNKVRKPPSTRVNLTTV